MDVTMYFTDKLIELLRNAKLTQAQIDKIISDGNTIPENGWAMVQIDQNISQVGTVSIEIARDEDKHRLLIVPTAGGDNQSYPIDAKVPPRNNNFKK